jgi:hypothetical protein
MLVVLKISSHWNSYSALLVVHLSASTFRGPLDRRNFIGKMESMKILCSKGSLNEQERNFFYMAVIQELSPVRAVARQCKSQTNLNLYCSKTRRLPSPRQRGKGARAGRAEELAE